MKSDRIGRQSPVLSARLCFCLFLAVAVTLAAEIAASVFGAGLSFSDVQSWQWHADAVERARAEGLLSGYPDGTFRPDSLVTCGEFLRMAVPEAPKTSAAHWADGYYREGLRRGLFTERDIRESALDRPMDRQRMALVYSRLLEETDPGLTGIQTARQEDGTVPPAPFHDVESESPYEYPIAVAAAAGLLKGYPGGGFRPEANLTRAEAATAFVRLLDYSGEGGAAPAEPTIAELADPVCLAYLNEFLSTIRFEGTSGNYSYSFSAPTVPEGYKNYISIMFFSPSGKQILTDHDYKSLNTTAHTINNSLGCISSLSEISSLSVNFSITPIQNPCWVAYSLMWRGNDDIEVRIQYEDIKNQKALTEYINSSFAELFVWK